MALASGQTGIGIYSTDISYREIWGTEFAPWLVPFESECRPAIPPQFDLAFAAGCSSARRAFYATFSGIPIGADDRHFPFILSQNAVSGLLGGKCRGGRDQCQSGEEESHGDLKRNSVSDIHCPDQGSNALFVSWYHIK